MQKLCSHPQKYLLVLLFLVLSASDCLAGELNGKVVGVHDGDTITLLTEEKVQVKIRLSSIDAPETKQAFGSASKKALSGLVFGKAVRVAEHGKDRYKRTLGDIYIGEVWVNLRMVEQCMAWLFLKYSKDPQIKAAELKAREARLGLWQDEKPVPPWEWRSAAKKKTAP